MVRSIKIASDVRNIHEVEYFLNSLLKDFRIERKTYCKMYLATTEGVNNAIIHGNKSDAQKQVDVRFEDQLSYFEIWISDSGKGFNIKTIQDPTHKDNIKKESGRGIFIMKQYADKVVWENNGSTVHLIFNK